MKRSLCLALLPLFGSLWSCGGSESPSNFSDDASGAGGAAGGETPVPPDYEVGPLEGGEHGSFPASVTEADAQSAYDKWKSGLVESCGANGARVRAEETTETLSEGVGFGALLSVAWADKATFDGLWTYYQASARAADQKRGTALGLMGWRVYGDACALAEVEPGAASFADLDMAMALLQAECQWGGGTYYAGAARIMAAVKNHLTKEVASGIVLLPGDNDDENCMNPAFSTPGYYRVFASAIPADAAFWNRMADDAYAFLGRASDSTTGLAPDWVANDVTACGKATDFVGYDGVRALWRVATDYVWFGTPAAKTWLDKVTGWAESSVGVEQFPNMQDGFFKDGSEVLGDEGKANSAFLGAFAVGAIPTGEARSEAFHGAFLAVPASNDGTYYTDTARALYLLFSANRFSPSCF